MWSAVHLENMDLDFVYEDADTHANEMAELYCYTEEQEILNNQNAFQEVVTGWNLPTRWSDMTTDQQALVLEKLSDGMELVDEGTRWRSVQALMYLIQGTFGECEEIDQSFRIARRNVMSAYSSGLFPLLIHLLLSEIETSTANAAAQVCNQSLSLSFVDPCRRHQAVASALTSAPGKRSVVTLSDSYRLRVILSMIYTFVEVMRVTGDDDTEREERLRQEFRDELNEPVGQSQELLAIVLFQMVSDKCSCQIKIRDSFLSLDKQIR